MPEGTTTGEVIQNPAEKQETKTEATKPEAGTGPNFSIAEHVPEALRSEAYFKTFEGKPIGEVLKSGLEAHKLVGSSVRIPGADAKPEEWDAFYAKTRPASVEGYKSPFKKEFADQHAPEGFMKDIFKAAHEVGLNQRQLEHMLKAYENTTIARSVSSQQELTLLNATAKATLMERYGDNYDKASAMASRAAKRFGGEALEQMIKDYNLESDPVFFDAFYNVAQLITEDSWVGGENKPLVATTKADAAKQIDAIYADKTHPYHNPQAASYKGAVEEVNRLRKIQYGE